MELSKSKDIYEIYVGNQHRHTSVRLGGKLGVGTVYKIYWNENYYVENGDSFKWRDIWKGEQDSLTITYKK